MNIQTIIIIVAVLAVIALVVSRLSGGPSVTQIDRTVRREKDEPGDRDDA